jgi:hypothetical protein
MSFGAGFFISAQGRLVTNYHVLSDVVERGQQPVFYVDAANTKAISRYRIIRCMDARDIDLCVVDLPYNPRGHLELRADPPRAGERVTTIGHPKGSDFSISEGSVVRVYPDIRRLITINDYDRNRSVELVRLNAELRKGYSGGPVVDGAGRLIAVNSVILHPPAPGGEDLILAITNRELRSFLARQAPFDLEAFSSEQIAKNPLVTTPAHRLTEDQIRKACRTLQRSACLEGIQAACSAPERKAECRRLRTYFKTVARRK